MKQKRFAYVFAVGAHVMWSGEDADFIINNRVVNADKDKVRLFTENSKPGSFISTSTGEMIFDIS